MYHPMMTLKALAFFEDEELMDIPKNIKTTFLSLVKEINIKNLPTITTNDYIGD